MTFLELCKALRRETSVSGTGPNAVTGQTGESARLVNWINQANTEIQLFRSDWKFLWAEGSFNTIASQGTYDIALAGDMGGGGNVISDFGVFELFDPLTGGGPRLSIGGTNISLLTWGEYDPLNYSGEAQPYEMVVRPDGKWTMLSTPDAVYAVAFNYYKTPTLLAADSDVSVIPTLYHDAIVSRAMMYYAEYEDAPELMSAGAERFDQIMDAMRATQLTGQEAFTRTSNVDIRIIPE